MMKFPAADPTHVTMKPIMEARDGEGISSPKAVVIIGRAAGVTPGGKAHGRSIS